MRSQFEISANKGRKCEYCDHTRPQAELNENGICKPCEEIIDRLREQYDMPEANLDAPNIV